MCSSPDEGNDDDRIGTLLAAAVALRQRPRTPGGPGGALASDLVAMRRAVDLIELEFSVTAAEYSTTGHYDDEGSVDPGEWIRHHCKMSAHDVSRALRVGEQLPALPDTEAALRQGRIGFTHVALLAGATAEIRGSATADPFAEQALLERALEHSVGRFRHDCAHARHAADMRRYLDAHLQTHEARSLELKSGSEGGLFIRGMLDGVAGATVRTALEALARRTGSGDDRDRAQRMADALAELAAHGLDAGVVPQQAGQRVHLHLTASVETLQGLAGAGAGDLDFTTPVPAVTAQRLACDAGITRVLFGADSAIIDVGRAMRLPSAATRRALNARDRGCVWPGCERPTSWTSAHHIRHWGHGGATDLENLALLCHRHHWMVHEGGWQLVRADDGAGPAMHAVPPPVPGYVPLPRAPDNSTAA